MTTWGTLTLEENPKMPMGVTGWEDAISPKVPRMITLRGNVSSRRRACLSCLSAISFCLSHSYLVGMLAFIFEKYEVRAKIGNTTPSKYEYSCSLSI